MLDSLPGALSRSPAGRRAAWVLRRIAAVASGAPIPGDRELADQFTEIWLSEVPVAATLWDAAPWLAEARDVRLEASPSHEARVLLELADGRAVRFRCVVERATPHRVAFQLFSPATDPSSHVNRIVDRDGRSVHVRDFGGDGPLLLLWHGAGCDASVWEAMVPYLGSFHVVAQDLPGHGFSSTAKFSIADAIADGRAVVDDLRRGDPLLAGHSLGGWAAMHYAATSPCRALVCLDGPVSLDYGAMGLTPDHHAYVRDAPDVARDLASLRCPTMIVLCRGSSKREREWMVPFRTPLSDYLRTRHPEVRVVWRPTGHLLVLSDAERTAALIRQFEADAIDQTRRLPN